MSSNDVTLWVSQPDAGDEAGYRTWFTIGEEPPRIKVTCPRGAGGDVCAHSPIVEPVDLAVVASNGVRLVEELKALDGCVKHPRTGLVPSLTARLAQLVGQLDPAMVGQLVGAAVDELTPKVQIVNGLPTFTGGRSYTIPAPPETPAG
ncbi:hypothetical protein [Blastococcus mobilis]|uniref:Uncharacterized protein n=1 Tax=Blastococcus mobilis TaxID=1938746 RepID=A0A238VWU3_9ACTN|nr:hypothetical protein [Blastococcus mobilis]SNR38792.1 hypothetical protein SAMN06272737_105123 [Blastococcus mobilis]